MAIVVKFEVNGMDVAKYESVIKELEKSGLGHPEGRLYHVAYGDKKKLQVIDVYESQAKLDAFGSKLVPILQKHGVAAKPEPIEAHNIIVPKGKK